jgi:hypothetical protein
MYHFETMPADAKAWVYAANRKLTPEEIALVNNKAQVFVTSWTAHQQQLKASFDLLHEVFFVIMVDENMNEVSGCGIDKSIHFMKEMEKELNINLFNRLQVELLLNDQVAILSKTEAQNLFNNQSVQEETPFFNKNISTKTEFDHTFMIPFNKSWVYQNKQKTQSV